MIYVNKLEEFTDITLTLGAGDTLSPPPAVIMVASRKGTNFTFTTELPQLGMIPGSNYITFVDIPTALWEESGQYSYQVFDNTDTEDPILLEEGLLIATTSPITKKQYGTDKKRGEYKGSS